MFKRVTRQSVDDERKERAVIMARIADQRQRRQWISQHFDNAGNLRQFGPSLFESFQTYFVFLQSLRAMPLSSQRNRDAVNAFVGGVAKHLNIALAAQVDKTNEVEAAGVDGDLDNAKLYSVIDACTALRQITSAGAEYDASVAQLSGIVRNMYEELGNYESTVKDADLRPCLPRHHRFIVDIGTCRFPTSSPTKASLILRDTDDKYTSRTAMSVQGTDFTWYVDCGAHNGHGKVWYLQNDRDTFLEDTPLFQVRLQWLSTRVEVYEFSTSPDKKWRSVGYFDRK